MQLFTLGQSRPGQTDKFHPISIKQTARETLAESRVVSYCFNSCKVNCAAAAFDTSKAISANHFAAPRIQSALYMDCKFSAHLCTTTCKSFAIKLFLFNFIRGCFNLKFQTALIQDKYFCLGRSDFSLLWQASWVRKFINKKLYLRFYTQTSRAQVLLAALSVRFSIYLESFVAARQLCEINFV